MTEGRDLPAHWKNSIAYSNRGQGSLSATDKEYRWDSEKEVRAHCIVEFQPLGSSRVTEELSGDPYIEFLDTFKDTVLLPKAGTWSKRLCPVSWGDGGDPINQAEGASKTRGVQSNLHL